MPNVPLRQSARCVFSRPNGDLTLDIPPPGTRGWRAVVRVLRSPLLRTPFHDLASVLLPSPCRVCGDPLLHVSLSPVCDTCLARILPQTTSLCVRCGENLGFESWRPKAQQVCELCRLAPPPFVRAVAYAVYQDELRRMLHLLKYERVRAVGAPLGRMLAITIADLEATAPREMTVVAVPLFASRERQRGYNQTVLIADAALALLAKAIPGWKLTADHALLVRQRATESQFRLSPTARRTNLRGAFTAPHPERVAGKDILLVDDIYTTGSTARECTRTLLRAGANSVIVATLSRAQADTYTTWEQDSFSASVSTAQAVQAQLLH